MKNIIISELDNSFVSFKSAIGSGIAVWAGKKPLLDSYQEIELDIDDHFEWRNNINLIGENRTSIIFSDDKLIFEAKIIACEDDGVLTVSLDGDIIFIEVSGENVASGYVSFVTTPDKVTLYPTDL
ncbi:hypothetical protein LVQ78_10155 [Buttiauxella sp. A2-C2_NF]|uniref:hypothetical protein n=1 Tax=Buttiauxella TaxID=82976 RepID=UPI00105C6345|nr:MULTISPECIES: hypothetical protein [Buttiauxella]MCE0826392.1 hypothetical protein [Buttiauxella ferragutiae]TDN50630.1 hypothetical protein EC843_105113 [Buttiauxella sp. JUb87]